MSSQENREFVKNYGKENFEVLSEEDLSDIKELLDRELPKEIIDYLKKCIPEEDIELDNDFVLFSLDTILEENEDAVPGVNILPYGFFTFAGTVDGDVLCVDLNSKENSVYLCSHSLLSDEEEIVFYKSEIGMVKLPFNYENIKKCSIKLTDSFEKFVVKMSKDDLEPIDIIETVIESYTD